jgi:hypothetical protein
VTKRAERVRFPFRVEQPPLSWSNHVTSKIFESRVSKLLLSKYVRVGSTDDVFAFKHRFLNPALCFAKVVKQEAWFHIWELFHFNKSRERGSAAAQGD